MSLPYFALRIEYTEFSSTDPRFEGSRVRHMPSSCVRVREGSRTDILQTQVQVEIEEVALIRYYRNSHCHCTALHCTALSIVYISPTVDEGGMRVSAWPRPVVASACVWSAQTRIEKREEQSQAKPSRVNSHSFHLISPLQTHLI